MLTNYKALVQVFYARKKLFYHLGRDLRYVTSSKYESTFKKRPNLIINENCAKRILGGFPWIYTNEVKNAEELFLYSPCVVNIKNEVDEYLGVGIYNKNSTIASRVLSRNVNELINDAFFYDRIRKAYLKRIQIFQNDNFYRVVHGESDQLPGVIIDKYDKIVSVQINASGVDVLLQCILSGIERVLEPEIIILKNDNPIRKLEGLSQRVQVYKGNYCAPSEVREQGLTFYVDLLHGQKTGYYFDHRENRLLLIPYCKDKRVLDLFSYVGSFGILLGYYGAKEVTCVDSSYPAIVNGIRSAQYNNVIEKVSFVHSCVNQFLNFSFHVQLQKQKEPLEINSLTNNRLMNEENKGSLQNDDKHKSTMKIYTKEACKNHPRGKTQVSGREEDGDFSSFLLKDESSIYNFLKKKYDVILIDPPPLARTSGCLSSALIMYQKLLFSAFKMVHKPGLVFVSSCNKLIGYNELILCIRKSLQWSKCEGVIIAEGRVGADHPVHISLQESKYLTSLLLQII